MGVTAIVGAQWGDEAKGKFVDLLAQNADLVARFNGGDNAGHTVVNQWGTFKFRLTPNGLFNPKTICAIGPGVVINLDTLQQEIELFQSAGLNLNGRLWISPRCHVVMPYHPLLESIFEQAKGKARTGTTKRGMGPVFADKVSYNGIRLYDLLDKDLFAEKLRIQLAIKNPILSSFGIQPLQFEAVYEEKLNQFAGIRPYVREPFPKVQEIIERQGEVILEGAQGALLDNNWGTYPYCTASITLAGGAAAGLGISPRHIIDVIGVAKAYTTRVGAGPMPTELGDEIGQKLVDKGHEYGTVTGRPRRCGWFDAEIVRFSAQLNGFTALALTKLDVLDELPVIKICVGYHHPQHGNERMYYWDGDARWLGDCKPEYIELPGWRQPTGQVRRFENLPMEAQAYVRQIEDLVGVPVKYVSVGPARQETIIL